jgi:hypothetical protein
VTGGERRHARRVGRRGVQRARLDRLDAPDRPDREPGDAPDVIVDDEQRGRLAGRVPEHGRKVVDAEQGPADFTDAEQPRQGGRHAPRWLVAHHLAHLADGQRALLVAELEDDVHAGRGGGWRRRRGERRRRLADVRRRELGPRLLRRAPAVGDEALRGRDQLGYPWIGDPVVHRPMLAAGGHEAAPAQRREVGRDPGLWRADRLDQLRHGPLAVRECGQQPQPGGIGEPAEGRRQDGVLGTVGGRVQRRARGHDVSSYLAAEISHQADMS